ncbi:hypothetical protein EMCG_05607 [[Emmonsia] crescens]|uniref:Uncharacterized protein n=1 Tax=[Emmonsia] crescens TaxID=73230 RepID=A0A0G2IE08_9EURO|nr:hypothetical protein EMCG_05607 [Emmonsia crescens UAMH 3008]
MDNLTFGVGIEILTRPRIESPAIRDMLEKENQDFTRPLDPKTNRLNANILQRCIVKRLCEEAIPAHLVQGGYSKWIAGRDGSIVEPKEEDGFKKCCKMRILKPWFVILMVRSWPRNFLSCI